MNERKVSVSELRRINAMLKRRLRKETRKHEAINRLRAENEAILDKLIEMRQKDTF